MMYSLIPLFCLVAVILLAWFWRSNLTAREIAIETAKEACQKNNLQLLDETVSISSLKIIKPRGKKFCFERRYQFEYYDGEQARKKGFITMRELCVLHTGFQYAASSENNIIDLKKFL